MAGTTKTQNPTIVGIVSRNNAAKINRTVGFVAKINKKKLVLIWCFEQVSIFLKLPAVNFDIGVFQPWCNLRWAILRILSRPKHFRLKQQYMWL